MEKVKKQHKGSVELYTRNRCGALDACVRFLPLFPQDLHLPTAEYKVYFPTYEGKPKFDCSVWRMPISMDGVDDPIAVKLAEKLDNTVGKRVGPYQGELGCLVSVLAPAQIIHYKLNGVEKRSLRGQVVICRFNDDLRNILNAHIKENNPRMLDIHRGSDVRILRDKTTHYMTSVSFSDPKPLMIDGNPATEETYDGMLRRECPTARLNKYVLKKEDWLVYDFRQQTRFNVEFGCRERSFFASPQNLYEYIDFFNK